MRVTSLLAQCDIQTLQNDPCPSLSRKRLVNSAKNIIINNHRKLSAEFRYYYILICNAFNIPSIILTSDCFTYITSFLLHLRKIHRNTTLSFEKYILPVFFPASQYRSPQLAAVHSLPQPKIEHCIYVSYTLGLSIIIDYTIIIVTVSLLVVFQ